jgi:hypothetical protein
VRISAPLILAAAIFATAAPAVAATVAPDGTHLVPGYYDPKTGTFKPVARPSAIGSNPNVSNVGGKFVVNFTITVASAIATSTPIYCQVNVNTSDPTNFVDESASVEATRRTATSAICTVTIPYAWYHLSTPTEDGVNLSYSLSVELYNSTTQSFTLSRESAQTITQLKAVPANGAITTESLAATI